MIGKLSVLIAAHAYPELLGRLITKLRRPFTSIYIHIDKGVDIRPFHSAFAELGIDDIHWVPRFNSMWATFGQVEASLSLLRQAVGGDRDSGRFILLSGQDYPLMPPEEMLAFFQLRQDVNFIESHPLPWKGWGGSGGMDRLEHFHFLLKSGRLEYPATDLPRSRRLKIAYALCKLALPCSRPLPPGIVFHGGANWWCLTREASQAVLDHVRLHPGFVRRFRLTKSADEIFFQTILANGNRQWRIDPDYLRCVFWDGRRNEFPATVRLEDFDEVAASGKLFVRKAHPAHSLPLLDRIDRELLKQGRA